MKGFSLDKRQKEYLETQYNLSSQELDVFLEDLFGFLQETPESFIRRRHRELQEKDWPNNRIYSQLNRELENRLFLSKKFTERQIRRIIYG